MYWVMTDDFKSLLREVDWVKIKGIKKPVEIYTIDLETDLMKGETYPY